MKTFTPKPQHIERRWYLVDADGAVLGRLATHVASVLKGKHKPIYAPHVDTGDHVIVVNASKVRLTGAKLQNKTYYHHSGYPGGLTEIRYERLMSSRPELVVEKAIRGMLPKTRLGRQMGRKLVVYAGGEHRQSAQQPQALGVGELPVWSGLPAPKPRPEPTAKAERPGKRAPARRSAAKKAAAKKAPAKKAPAKRAPAAKRAAAKKAPAKRATKKES
jgi:large subunit ribosomal protein L13